MNKKIEGRKALSLDNACGKVEVIRAEKMGFCFGVKNAVDSCYELVSQFPDRDKYILGMVVHNKIVVKEMENLGFKIVTEEEILEDKDNLKENDILIIRAHGTTRQILNKLIDKKINIIDATCIFVKKIKEILVEEEKQGNEIIFIGDENHPEVKGIISYGEKVKVFKDIEQFKNFDVDVNKNYVLLTQTTLNKSKFQKLVDYIDEKYRNIKIYNRICGATGERQEATKNLAKKVDVMIVIGDLKSSNSKKLLEVALEYNKNSYLIQNEDELRLEDINGANSIGITAGASTPESIIEKIEKKLLNIK